MAIRVPYLRRHQYRVGCLVPHLHARLAIHRSLLDRAREGSSSRTCSREQAGSEELQLQDISDVADVQVSFTAQSNYIDNHGNFK